jgi:hypothetical protein
VGAQPPGGGVVQPQPIQPPGGVGIPQPVGGNACEAHKGNCFANGCSAPYAPDNNQADNTDCFNRKTIGGGTLGGQCCILTGAAPTAIPVQPGGNQGVQQNFRCTPGAQACNPTFCTAGVDVNCYLDAGACNAACAATKTAVALIAHLSGIGKGTTSSGAPENANPQRNTVTAVITAIDTANGQATGGQTSTGTLIYNPTNGNYESQQFPLPANLQPADYKLLIHIDHYLDQQVVGADGSTSFGLPVQTVSSKVLALLPGDIMPTPKGDNYIDIQDYNTMLGCMNNNGATCPDPTKADLNGDGKVDNIDLQLLLDHFGSVGASPTTPKFTCTADPSCANVKQTLQLCPMQCKVQ